jgi:hypothetical protein
MLYCHSDNWDNTGSTYVSVEEFLDMCRECHGEAPDLQEKRDGLWFDVANELVLASENWHVCELCGGTGTQRATGPLGQALKCSLCDGLGMCNGTGAAPC